MEFFICMEKKRYHIVIGSILFAVVMWLSVNMRDEYTVVRRVPVVLENMKDGKALKYPIPKTMSIRFRGTGWLLAGLSLTPDIQYFIDMSSIGTEDFIITGKDLFEHIKLPFSLQSIDIKPDSLVLAVEDYTEKRVPIEPKFMLEFHDGYGQVGAIHLSPDSTTIGGAEHIVRSISSWHTAYKKFDDIRAPIDLLMPVEESPDYSLEVSATTTRLQVNVQPFAEKTFIGIPVTANGTPFNREVIFIPPKIDIIVRGGIDQLAKLSPSDFQATVDYQDIDQDSVTTIVPQLSGPEEIKIVSQKPERFQYIIRKRL